MGPGWDGFGGLSGEDQDLVSVRGSWHSQKCGQAGQGPRMRIKVDFRREVVGGGRKEGAWSKSRCSEGSVVDLEEVG